MGIMDMFRPQAPAQAAPAQQQAPAPTPGTPGNMPAAPVVSNMPGTGVTPNNSVANQPDNTTSQSPLDAFKDLFTIDPATSNPANSIPTFNVDQAKLREAAAKNDFSKVIPPELLEKIAAGGAEAQQAMMAAMNAMSQRVYADSAFATTQILEAALKKQAEAIESRLPGLIKNQNLSESLRTENPIFSHPAAAPMLDTLQKQVLQKFPNATVTEQKEMAQKWLLSFAEAASPVSKVTETAGKGEDWSAFFDN